MKLDDRSRSDSFTLTSPLCRDNIYAGNYSSYNYFSLKHASYLQSEWFVHQPLGGTGVISLIAVDVAVDE
jgi:hypothetical protein